MIGSGTSNITGCIESHVARATGVNAIDEAHIQQAVNAICADHPGCLVKIGGCS